MYHPYYDMQITSGYLIVLRFSALYAKYAPKYHDLPHMYALPDVTRAWSQSAIQYRGTDRDALDANPLTPTTMAEIFLADLEKEHRCADGLLFAPEDVAAALSWLEDQADQYEVIWVREYGAHDPPPEGFTFLGFEPSYFTGDHFSASCDCMLIPRWHGTDQDGTLFLEHFRRLNQHGLFDTEPDARNFLEYYVSFDWTENDRSDYLIVEVFARLQ